MFRRGGRMKFRTTLLQTIAVCFVLGALALGQDLASFEKRTTVKKLANGLTIVICERPEAPVFSFFTHVDAGSVQDPMGKTGLAHMFEHMAFKGTDTIGTRDYAGEKVSLAKVEEAYGAYIAERDQPVGRDERKLTQLEQSWKDAIAAADKFSAPYNNEFGKIVEGEGGEGMNAFTNLDETAYHYSFPINRLELWAYLESERFVHPVMRQFYKERNVVIGVGDVKVSEAMPIVEKYFSRIPARPKPDTATTTEPAQKSERTVVLHEQSQPLYLEGYHRPDYRSPDDEVYDAIADLMSNGRTSRLYRALVRDKQIASDSAGFTGLPGNKYPHLFAFFATPIPGHTPQEVGDAIHVEIERLKKEDISDEELRMIKTRAKANLIRALRSNEGLAFELELYQARY